MDLAETLRRLRHEKHLTLKALSERSGLPLSTINAIEKGRTKNPSFAHLKTLAKALEVPERLLYLEDGEKALLCHKGDLKGAVQMDFRAEGFSLISYTPLTEETFIGKAVLKPKRTLDLTQFPRLRLLFVQIIFGKLEANVGGRVWTLTEGEHLTLGSPERTTLSNPLQTRDSSFLAVSIPSLVSASLASRILST